MPALAVWAGVPTGGVNRSPVRMRTETPPARPPVRVTVRIASPPSSLTLKFGALNWMVPPRSSSLMVTTAVAGAISANGAGGASSGLLSATTNVRSACGSALSTIGTEKVAVVDPGAKVTVPLVSV